MSRKDERLKKKGKKERKVRKCSMLKENEETAIKAMFK